MIYYSSIANQATPGATVLSYALKLKSRYAGDTNEIRSVHFRSPSWSSGAVSCEEGVMTATGAQLHFNKARRGPLMHHSYQEVNVTGGTGAVSVTPRTPFFNIFLLVKPNSGTFRVSTASANLTLTLSGGLYSVTGSTGIAATYLNGSLFSAGSPFPISRLIAVSFSAEQTGPIQIGNTWNGAGSIDTFAMSRLVFASGYNGTSRTALTATQVANHANALYRKNPTVGQTTDETVLVAPGDAVKTLPESWVVVSSS